MEVFLDDNVAKELKKPGKIPQHIQNKLNIWIASVEITGLEETKKIAGYHDHPLKGNKEGRRAISLNKQWRAEYILEENDDTPPVVTVLIVEIHAHDY